MTDVPLLALTRQPSISDRAEAQNMRQLMQLRWLAVAGQLVTILYVRFELGVPLPLGAMLAVLVLLACVNGATLLLLRRRAIGNAELLMALLVDVGSLTAQLYLGGGATNPFISLFLLQVVLGAILLDRWAVWAIVAVTAACFGVLTVRYRPLEFPTASALDIGGLYTLGNWICFALVATLLVLFVTRISRNLRARDLRLADLRQQAAEEDHIVRMGMLASGAAHELGTPLASLSVILADWRRMPALAGDADLLDEIAEMQGEVSRCKAIVTGILQSAGEPRGEAPEVVDARAFLDAVVGEWRQGHHAAPLRYHVEDLDDEPIVAEPALRQALWNLLDNALAASPGWVELVAVGGPGALVMTVRDRGPGFSPDLLAAFGKPYLSSKSGGHGVGLFLAVNVVRKLGGTVVADNPVGGGARVSVTLPLAAIGLGRG